MARKRLDDNVRMDRRKVQNREAAERCRKKKLGLINELEKKVKHYESLLEQCEKCKSLCQRYQSIPVKNESTDTDDSSAPASVKSQSTISRSSSQSSSSRMSSASSSFEEYHPQNSAYIPDPILYQCNDHTFIKPTLPPMKPCRLMKNHLNALASPLDVKSTFSSSTLQYSQHDHFTIARPMLLRSNSIDEKSPPLVPSLTSPGGFMVGEHHLRDLCQPNTGLTPFPGPHPIMLLLSPAARSCPPKTETTNLLNF